MKNDNGLTPINLAIKDKNFRCLELLLSIGLHDENSGISETFLSDFRFLVKNQIAMGDKFFAEKFIKSVSCERIQKVRWNIDDEEISLVLPSQLFTTSMIESHTVEDFEDDPANLDS